MKKKVSTTNGNKKRMFIIAGVLVAIALIIVLLSSRSTYTYPTASVGLIEPGLIAYEDDFYTGSDAIEMESSYPLAEKRVQANVAGIASDEMMIQPVVDDSIPRANTDQHIIKNGNFSLRVVSLDESAKTITTIAKNYDGDVTGANFSTRGNDVMYGFMTVKVPVDHFEDAMRDIKKIATVVENESVTTSDVTEQVIDLTATLTNKKAQEERLRAFFDEAESVTDLLAIEQQLTAVRGEIERIEGRLKSLTNRTSFSAITIQLSEDTQVIIPSNDWRPLEVAKDAVNSLIKSFQNIVDSTINLAISSLPLFLLSLLGLWVVYFFGKKLVLFISNRMHKEENKK